jgi:hypothetical protein
MAGVIIFFQYLVVKTKVVYDYVLDYSFASPYKTRKGAVFKAPCGDGFRS